ncbi:hypothetical protein N7456_007568 [Penicillium angulare]|uniref:Uncharacterized protein n=1 Tax=Penicillium angulare TaxID=116970 RepID=A0A9W9FBC7_9EURO|nr:hypothetical protein N7456_007568 [Penicillium angulare]
MPKDQSTFSGSKRQKERGSGNERVSKKSRKAKSPAAITEAKEKLDSPIDIQSTDSTISEWKNTLAPREPRMWPVQDPPITHASKIPAEWDWNADEPGLIEEDVEGNIVRCHQRIQMGILPQVFEKRLKMYEGIKRAREKMMEGEPAGLSWEVVQRLDSLKFLEKRCKEDTEGIYPYNEVNIKAIMAAYRSGEIEWYHGAKVTIWFRGEFIDGPIEFNETTISRLYDAFGGEHGIWVEGYGTPEPGFFGLSEIFYPTTNRNSRLAQHLVTFALRVPGSDTHMTLEFRDDTGAFAPMISRDDLWSIQRAAGSGLGAAHLGGEVAREALGKYMQGQKYVLDVMVINNQAERIPMTRWVQTVFFVVDHRIDPEVAEERKSRGLPKTPPTERLSGSWWRHMLYTATVPDNNRYIYTGTKKSEMETVPDVDFQEALAPRVPVSIASLSQQAKKGFKITGWVPPNPGENDSLRAEDFDGRKHPPTYQRYLEWVEKENERRTVPLEPTADDFRRYRLDQRNWTNEQPTKLKQPTWDQYLQWLHRRNRTLVSDVRGSGEPVIDAFGVYHPTIGGFVKFKSNQANWLEYPVEEEKGSCPLQ